MAIRLTKERLAERDAALAVLIRVGITPDQYAAMLHYSESGECNHKNGERLAPETSDVWQCQICGAEL